MLRVRSIFRASAIVVPLLAMTSAILVAPPAAAAATKPASIPKQYVASISVVPVPLSTAVTITVTFTNMPGSAALGSAQVTVPSDFTGVSLTNPAISAVSANKKWKASKPANSNVITLTALSDSQKLQPGQFVSVRFTATPPSTTSGDIFFTQAKASTNFTGVSFFTNIGSDPVVTICDSNSSCTTQFGDPNAPPRDVQTAEVSLDSPCPGTCIVTLGGTAGDFCSLSPNPPSTPCRTHVGPDVKIDGYTGGVTEYLSCNNLDCPPPTGGGTFAGANFYPVWVDKSDGPTTTGDTVLKVDNFCTVEGPTPCLASSGFIFNEGGGSFYQSQLEMTFPFDPKTLH